MRKLFYIFLIIFFIAGDCLYIHFFLNSSSNKKDSYVVIKKGSSINSILTTLENERIINNKVLLKIFFKLTAKFTKKNNIKFGEYFFRQGETHKEIIDKLLNGKVNIRTITFAEGLSNDTIIKMLNKNEFLTGEIDNSYILEGTLLPETYSYQLGDKRQDILVRMRKDLITVLKKEWEQRDSDLPYRNMMDALIMASIVEKETAVDSERKLVASVFINRLKIDMPLQTDPTSIYGYAKGDVSKEKDKPVHILLRENSPYNTYKNRGLPPTPICNVGVKSIKAVLHPAKTDYIFFVATGKGGHIFAETYKEHLKNIDNLRRVKSGK